MPPGVGEGAAAGVPVAAGALGVRWFGAPTLMTRTITHTRPKPVLLAVESSQKPRCVPTVVGAVSGTRISTVAPGAVFGTATLVVVVIASPLRNLNE